jgi:hypothetical protein
MPKATTRDTFRAGEPPTASLAGSVFKTVATCARTRSAQKPGTSKLYHRTKDSLTRDEVERIRL